jgi:hypothetical protein
MARPKTLNAPSLDKSVNCSEVRNEKIVMNCEPGGSGSCFFEGVSLNNDGED